MKKIIVLAAFVATASAAFAQNKTAEPTQADVMAVKMQRIAESKGISTTQLNAETFANQLIQRYSLNEAQAKSAREVISNALPKLNDIQNIESRSTIMQNILEACATSMTTPQRRQLLADFKAGMYK